MICYLNCQFFGGDMTIHYILLHHVVFVPSIWVTTASMNTSKSITQIFFAIFLCQMMILININANFVPRKEYLVIILSIIWAFMIREFVTNFWLSIILMKMLNAGFAKKKCLH